jgi:hypothetical protein
MSMTNESNAPDIVPESERRARFNRLMKEEAVAGKETCFWLSFCDLEKPQGQQHLGVIIMRTLGLAHAIDRAWKLGINPGGEVLSCTTDGDSIRPEHFDRLLTADELVAAGYCDAANPLDPDPIHQHQN